MCSAQINPTDPKDNIKGEEIGQVKKLGLWYAACQRFVKDGDTSYAIFFNNAKYTTITDVKHFKFNETGGDFEKLAQIIETGLIGKEKKEVEIPLEDGKLTLEFMGKTMRFNWFSAGVLSYSIPMKLDQVQKLLGRYVEPPEN